MQVNIFNIKRDKLIPADAVYVGRPSQWGNPFSVEKYGRAEAIVEYNDWIFRPEQDALREKMRQELKGLDLICFCTPNSCHAETIMRIANEE